MAAKPITATAAVKYLNKLAGEKDYTVVHPGTFRHDPTDTEIVIAQPWRWEYTDRHFAIHGERTFHVTTLTAVHASMRRRQAKQEEKASEKATQYAAIKKAAEPIRARMKLLGAKCRNHATESVQAFDFKNDVSVGVNFYYSGSGEVEVAFDSVTFPHEVENYVEEVLDSEGRVNSVANRFIHMLAALNFDF